MAHYDPKIFFKVVMFYISLFTIGKFSMYLLSNETVNCKYLDVINTNITISNNPTNNIISAFYACSNDEIVQTYLPESTFIKNQLDKDFVFYKNFFGKSTSYHQNWIEMIILYLAFSPFILSTISRVTKLIYNL